MKRLLTILMSLSLAAGALAQQDETTPANKRHQRGQKPGQEQAEPAAQGAARPNQEARPARQANQRQERKAMRQQRAEGQAPAETKAAPESAATAAPAASAGEANATAKGKRHNKQNMKQPTNAAETTTANQSASPANTSAKTETAASTTANQPAGKRNMKAKPDPQVVQKVKSEHVNFKAQPRRDKVPTVTFNQSYRINGAQQWQGPQYEVFRTYQPQRHDQGWYRSHYPRVEIIAGGAYYFNNGFWFPAWGYDPGQQYYAYDAPIYVGSRAEPPDRVIADVQALLQQQGYYKGEVDGLLGPLTREALTEYQTDNGLYATATIDEPTLASLNLG
ncbi:MAG: peptidoglycan-binding domain-containing protein [Chthoniobacterales bacterium]